MGLLQWNKMVSRIEYMCHNQQQIAWLGSIIWTCATVRRQRSQQGQPQEPKCQHSWVRRPFSSPGGQSASILPEKRWPVHVGLQGWTMVLQLHASRRGMTQGEINPSVLLHAVMPTERSLHPISLAYEWHESGGKVASGDPFRCSCRWRHFSKPTTLLRLQAQKQCSTRSCRRRSTGRRHGDQVAGRPQHNGHDARGANRRHAGRLGRPGERVHCVLGSAAEGDRRAAPHASEMLFGSIPS